MKLKKDGWYQADKGKHFVLTEKGKKEVASYRHKTIGEPVSEYDTEAVGWSVDDGYEIEVNIPDWITKIGYEVVYDHGNYTLHAGNPMIFPEKEIAKKYKKYYQSLPWTEHDIYIRETIFEGKALKECRKHDGKKVYNKDWYYGPDALEIGDFVENEIVDDLINCLPPVCIRNDCVQGGGVSSSRIDENGKTRDTFTTFKQIDSEIWEYCGDCFKGENVQHGTERLYV